MMTRERPPRGGARTALHSRPLAAVKLLAQRSSGLRPAFGFGALYGLIGGLLGTLQALLTAAAISLNQQQILRYQDLYALYRECLRQGLSDACQPPTEGALTVGGIWLFFLGSYLAALLLALVAYGAAARRVRSRSRRRGAGVLGALVAGVVGWLIALGASIAAVFAQASPFTMSAPPPGVDTAAVHVGAAIGAMLFDCAALLPTVACAALAGLLGASGQAQRQERHRDRGRGKRDSEPRLPRRERQRRTPAPVGHVAASSHSSPSSQSSQAAKVTPPTRTLTPRAESA
jgi:hypothetical protein